MTNDRRYPYTYAAGVANEIVSKLAAFCRFEPLTEGGVPGPMILVAGSIRRQREYVHDIDIVTAPKRPRDLFGTVDATKPDFLSQYLDRKGVTMERNGPNLKTFKYGQLMVDVYQVFDLDLWGWTVALRTGSAEFNKLLLQSPAGVTSQGGSLIDREYNKIATRYETDVFKAFGIPWIDPVDREPGLAGL